MRDKGMEVCKYCKYSVYDAINEEGWNCNNRNSKHHTKDWDLAADTILECDVFAFPFDGLKKYVLSNAKRAEEKAQTTLGDF